MIGYFEMLLEINKIKTEKGKNAHFEKFLRLKIKEDANMVIAEKGYKDKYMSKWNVKEILDGNLLFGELAEWEAKLKRPTNKSGVKTFYFKNGNVRKGELYKYMRWFLLDQDLKRFKRILYQPKLRKILKEKDMTEEELSKKRKAEEEKVAKSEKRRKLIQLNKLKREEAKKKYVRPKSYEEIRKKL